MKEVRWFGIQQIVLSVLVLLAMVHVMIPAAVKVQEIAKDLTLATVLWGLTIFCICGFVGLLIQGVRMVVKGQWR